jgi:hypothetical protein
MKKVAASKISIGPLEVFRSACFDKATVPRTEMRGGEALKAYKRYAGRMAKDMKGSELALLAEILGQEAVIQPRLAISYGALP